MSETTDNKKADFEIMLALAEFGAKRMEQRRSVEFRIFISYTTLLVLALYQLIKQSPITIESLIYQLIRQNPAPIEWGILGAVILFFALFIHIIYVIWQVGVGIAMKNDATRRNFYLRKAECISGYPLVYSNCNAKNKIFPIENYGQQFCHLSIIWTDWSRMLLVAIPTFLFMIVVDLFIKKTDLPFWYRIVAIVIEILLIKLLFFYNRAK